jgi:hypothetical protein
MAYLKIKLGGFQSYLSSEKRIPSENQAKAGRIKA